MTSPSDSSVQVEADCPCICSCTVRPANCRLNAPEAVRTQFDYLLNAVISASQAEYPAKAGYAEKRRALFAHVRELERRAALPIAPSDAAIDAAIAAREVRVEPVVGPITQSDQKAP